MLVRFIRSEPAAAVVLLCAAALAMIVANSPLGSAYEDVLHAKVLGLSVLHWINDGLMGLFFLLVGIEIKQELFGGELSSWGARALPGIAAAGGMLVPALIFVAVNSGDPDHLAGWAIPSATDIAFSIGVLALIGSRVPSAIRIILVSIAIIDDLGAIVIIALFYSSDLAVGWLGLAAVSLAALVILNRRHVYSLVPYGLVGVALWICLYQSGIHATLSGVALALAIPSRNTSNPDRSPMKVTEHSLLNWVNFGILPLFGFANAGVAFSGLERSDVLGTLPLGVALGLFLGKQIGIFSAIWLTIRSGLAPMPAGVSWVQIHAMAVICGIGFTMSLFIGGLAFANDPHLLDATKVGVIGGSICSAIVGTYLMRRTFRDQRVETVSTST
jgi:NhaA family Na+:H+ antiporter